MHVIFLLAAKTLLYKLSVLNMSMHVQSELISVVIEIKTISFLFKCISAGTVRRLFVKFVFTPFSKTISYYKTPICNFYQFIDCEKTPNIVVFDCCSIQQQLLGNPFIEFYKCFTDVQTTPKAKNQGGTMISSISTTYLSPKNIFKRKT